MNLFDLAATLRLETSEFENGIKSARASAAVFAQNMTKSSLNFSSMGKNLRTVGQSLVNFGQGIVSVGKKASVVTAGVGTVLGLAFNKAKNYIATYESAMTTFRHSAQVGEQGAQALYDALLNVAQRSAYARDVFFSAGQALVSMGLDANDTTKYIQAITDITAKMGKPASNIEELADLFGKLSLQTNLYTQDINQMVTAGIPAWSILATHYHKTTDEVKKMAKDGLIPAKESLDVVTDALEETNEQSEMFQYSAAGMANALKQGTLTGALDSLDSSFRSFATRLLDLDPATDSGRENIASLNKTILAFGETMKKIGEKFSFVGDWIRTGLQNVTSFLEKFNQALDNMPQEQAQAIARTIAVIAAAGPVLILVGNAVIGLGQSMMALSFIMSGGLTATLGALWGALVGLAPVFGIIAAVVAVVALAFNFLKEHWDAVVAAWNAWLDNTGLRDTLDSIGKKFSELGEKLGGLHDLFQVLGAICAAVVVPIFAVIMSVFNGLMSGLDGLMTALGGLIDFLSGIGKLIVGIFTLDGDKILEGLNQIGTGILEMFVGLFAAIDGFWNGLFGGLKAWLGQLWNGIVNWMSGVFAKIGAWGSQVLGSIGAWFSGLWNSFTGWLSGIFNSFIVWAAGLLVKVITWLAGVWASLTGWFSRVWNSLVQWLSNIVNNVSKKFQELQNKVREIWERVKTAIMTPINNAYNTVRSVVDRIKSTVSSAFNSVKSTVTNIWNNIKSSISNTINSIKDNVSNVFNSVKNTVSSIWNGITGTISSAINSAKDAVWWAIDRIRSFFNFSISWPHIPLPHFSISPPGWTVGDLLQGSIPSLNIAWYAKGGIFTKPTLFPTTNGFNGVGEAGAEAVLPIETLRGYIVDAMAEGVREAQISYKESSNAKANSGMVNALISAIKDSEKEINVYIGGKQIVSEIYQPLMDTMRKKEVSVGA